MSIVLARIDDRLIHGQVIVGWGEVLRLDRIVLANDDIAADPWQKRVYGSSVPPRIAVSILGLAESVEAFCSGLIADREDVLLLTERPRDMAELARLGLDLEQVNVGGLHDGDGKLEMLPFVYLDHDDVLALIELRDRGVGLLAQQVPGGRSHLLATRELRELEDLF